MAKKSSSSKGSKKSTVKRNVLAVEAPRSIEETVRVKRISNGYVISKSTYGKDEGYKEKEIYSKTKPKITF